MKARVEWALEVRKTMGELPADEQEAILDKIDLLLYFPRMYQRLEKGRFRRHRRFVAGNWAVYYRVVENTVYIRGLWPARMPLKLVRRR